MRRLLPALLLLLGFAPQEPPARPNILWITCEDISPNLGCYGDSYAVTPNLDRLATQSLRYTNAFAPIGVCAPSRSSLILGVYASSAGTHPMRCKGALSDALKCFPEYLRNAGYYCTNNEKTDYNFEPPRTAWDESSKKAHWRGRKKDQRFFAVFNILTSHESQIRLPEAAYQKRTAHFSAAERHDPAKAVLPPYHPDTPEVRRDWARYADMITLMDQEAGAILKQLDDDGLADDTIVFYFSDHGAGLPRSKRWLYDSSLRVPFMIRFPEKWKALAPSAPGTTSDRLITFVDVGPSVLSLAGVPVAPAMQGRPFLGAAAAPAREYIHGFRDRMDERSDVLRAVRDRRWKYIRNYHPERPWAQHVSYMYEMPSMKAWQRLHDEGKLEGPQKRFFETKPAEELYDLENDPWELRNLAAEPAQQAPLERLRAELKRWILESRDLGFLPEADLRTRFGATAPYDGARRDAATYPLGKILDAAERASRGEAVEAGDADPAVRYWAMQSRATTEDALRGALRDDAPFVRVAAADALARRGKPDEAMGVLIAGLAHENEWVRLQAAEALDRLGTHAAPAREAIQAVADDRNEYVKRVAAHLLSTLKP